MKYKITEVIAQIYEQNSYLLDSGFGRYDVMLTPKDREKDCSYIIEFKVHKPTKE